MAEIPAVAERSNGIQENPGGVAAVKQEEGKEVVSKENSMKEGKKGMSGMTLGVLLLVGTIIVIAAIIVIDLLD